MRHCIHADGWCFEKRLESANLNDYDSDLGASD